MRLELVPISTLPRLAWAARVRAGDPVVRVWHGDWVETRDDAFVEGAWAAPFAEWGFDRAPDLAGSGGRITPGGVLFATPGNMYERLYALRAGDALYVSGSLAFVLALSGDRLDPAHRHYFHDFLDHYRVGFRVKRKTLRLANGRAVALHDCCNLAVGPDAAVTRVEKPWDPAAPADYADYVALLEDTIRRMIANAADPARRRCYRPLAMLSTGYDANAVAALARRVGCTEAVTFLRSNRSGNYLEDSGAEVGRSLGLAVTSYERNDCVLRPDYRSEEFYVEPWGVDRTMAAMEEQLAGSLLLSGRSCEAVWSRGGARHWGLREFQHPLNKLPGCALGELRMRTGFLHFAPATVAAALHAPRIHAWNESPELRPWSIGGDYDKPIARRILEEAGVPRALFGQQKKGGYQRPLTPRNRIERWVDRLEESPRIRTVLRGVVGNRFHPRWKSGSLAVQVGVGRMIARYEAALAGYV